MSERSQPGAGFVFVNFANNNPDQAQNGAAHRKAVRSQAATYSHRVAPRKGMKAARYQPRTHRAPVSTVKSELPPSNGNAKGLAGGCQHVIPPASIATSSSNSNAYHVSPPNPPAKRAKAETSSGEDVVRLRTPSPKPFLRAVKLSQSPRHRTPRRLVPTPANIGRKRSRQDRSPSVSLSRSRSPSFDKVTYGRLPDPTYLDAGPKDPFETYPVSYQPWYGWLLDYWYNHTLLKANKLVKCTPHQMSDYVLWSRGFEVTEPALYYTSLFLATGIPVANGSFHVNRALWLRGEAVKALNEALSDPLRATSNAVISAVGKIALHEHIYGDRQAAHAVHRPAQQRMIALRGGVEKLGLPTITLQLMVWYDALMAAESKTEPYFRDVPRKMAVQSFSNEEAVRVTNLSSPRRHLHPGYGGK